MNTTAEPYELLQRHYPEVSNLLHSTTSTIIDCTQQARVPAGTHLFREHEHCKNFMWLLGGTVRVFKHSPEGRQITLYRVNPGELCVLSLQCLLSDEGYPAEAVAETELYGLTLSKPDFDKAIDDSKDFRSYLLKFISHRLGDVVQLVSDITFKRLDLRIACLLGQLFERSGGEPLQITHMQIARELGTTREVTSRILKELELQECIKLSRGKIHLVSSEGLSWSSRT